jgi:hypothetical protein
MLGIDSRSSSLRTFTYISACKEQANPESIQTNFVYGSGQNSLAGKSKYPGNHQQKIRNSPVYMYISSVAMMVTGEEDLH